ncbi:arginine--tRNA ligase [Patescibacteria group bacterium]|nr:arginine--tRNA ligase [Patescibacteria group bacterium]
MNILFEIKESIAKSINKNTNKSLISAVDIMYPPNTNMGDLSLPCFNVAKMLGIQPHEATLKIKEILTHKKNKYISTIQIAGPYLNIVINQATLAKEVLNAVTKKTNKYGQNKAEKKERIMLEYSNANTHKDYHIGHLRNVCFGDSAYRILKANGHKAIPVSYINDFGIHVAKTLWCLNEYYKKEIPDNNKGEFLGKVYTESAKKIEETPTAKNIVSLMMKKIESRTGEEYELWQKTRTWSIDQFNKVYKELGVKFDHIFYESEFIEKGIKEVKKLKEDGILSESDGAIIANLEKYDLGVLVIMRTDKTALYPVADIPLAIYKLTKFKLDKSIYIVDIRQGLYFKQLFKLLELMGHKQDLVHLGYDFVKLPSGMMSSRSGNIISYTELKKELINAARKEIIKRHERWNSSKIEKTAKTLAIASMKFEMLKVDSNQIITFNINTALKFEGFTAGYIQYTYARINSIINKYKLEISENEDMQAVKKLNYAKLEESKENEIILKLAKYSEEVARAGERYSPNIIAKYLFELSQLSNDYYHRISILKSDNEAKIARISLIIAINQVIKNGLDLLGIEVLDEM